MKNAILFILLLISASGTHAGPLAYGICQSGCNGLAVACYAAGGAVSGTGKETTISF